MSMRARPNRSASMPEAIPPTAAASSVTDATAPAVASSRPNSFLIAGSATA